MIKLNDRFGFNGTFFSCASRAAFLIIALTVGYRLVDYMNFIL